MFSCEWRRAYSRMQGAIHGKAAQKNNADVNELNQVSTSIIKEHFCNHLLFLGVSMPKHLLFLGVSMPKHLLFLGVFFNSIK